MIYKTKKQYIKVLLFLVLKQGLICCVSVSYIKSIVLDLIVYFFE